MVEYVGIAYLKDEPYTVRKLTLLSSTASESQKRRADKYSAWLFDLHPELWVVCDIAIVRKYDLRKYIHKLGPNNYIFKIIYYKLHGSGVKRGRAPSKYDGVKEGEQISECSKCGTQLWDYVSPTGQVLHKGGEIPIAENPIFNDLFKTVDTRKAVYSLLDDED